MDIIAGQAVSGAKTRDPLAQYAFLTFQPFGLALTGSDFGKEAFNQRGHRGVLLGGLDARSPVCLVVKCYCDIFHIFTLAQLM
jgi:hypothetical protein